jgi:hypothetical protein
MYQLNNVKNEARIVQIKNTLKADLDFIHPQKFEYSCGLVLSGYGFLTPIAQLGT